MLKSLVHVQPLQLWLLAGGDDIDVIASPQTMIEDTQETVAVRRIVHADDFTPARQSIVDKACCLMAESIVIVTPCMTCEQNVQRCDRFAPWILLALLKPLGMLRHHGINNLRKCLVGRPHTMPAREQISFKPPFAQMFAQYLQHTAIRAELIVDGDEFSHRAARGCLENGVQPVRVRFIGAEHAKVHRIHSEYVAEEFSQFARSFGQNLARSGNLEGIIGEVGQNKCNQLTSAIYMRIATHAPIAPWRQGFQFFNEFALLIEEFL